METFLIPLSNIPEDFTIDLSGVEYRIVCKFNSAELGGWVIDIYDSITNNPLVMNIPLVTGVDLLKQYKYLGIKGSLIVYTDGNELSTPTLENLGSESNLYYKTEV